MVEPPPPTLHAAFGLLWHSPDLPLNELPEAEAGSAGGVTMQVRDETGCVWPDLPPGPHDTTTLQMGRADLRFRVEGTGRFRITAGERIAWQRHDGSVSAQEISALLLGSAMAALLIQRGVLVLHGNALAKDGGAIVCIGHSGAGKSTLAYALMQQGWQLLADDLVAITPDGRVLPGIPRIKLWHDAAEAFGLDPLSLPQIHRSMRKYVLSGKAVQRALQPMPLQALYLIEAGTTDGGKEDLMPITSISSEKAAAQHLRTQTFLPRFVRGMGQEGRNFLATAQLQRTVPLARLPLPRGIERLQDWLQEQDLLQAVATARGRPEIVRKP